MAKRMTLKQKLHFGSKRQRASAQAAISRKRKTAKRHNAAPRTRPVSRKRTQVASDRPRTQKRNMGEVVYLLGANPAKRRKSNMAKTKTQRRAGSRKQNPARLAHKTPVVVRRHRRSKNPGSVDIMGYAKLGASVVGGAVGSKAITQAVLSSSNTGMVGYFGNLVATIALGWGAHVAFRDKIIAQGVVGGGLAQIIVRALSDNTPYGSMLSNSGVGDYQANWNFVWPQRVQPGYPPRYIAAPGTGGGAPSMPVVTHAAPSGSTSGAKAGMGNLQRWN